MGTLLQSSDYYELSFLEKRKAFLNSLLRVCTYNHQKVNLLNPMVKWSALHLEGHKDFWCNYEPGFKVNTIKSENEETADQAYDMFNFDPNWNNRDILISEAVIEFDSPDFIKNLDAVYGTCLNLIKLKVHFALFYADGMKCPHIHIYDLFQDCDDWAVKNISMVLFCRKVIPFEYFHLADKNLWEPHKIALEFSKHWRTGHIKKLLFEHIPEVKQ